MYLTSEHVLLELAGLWQVPVPTSYSTTLTLVRSNCVFSVAIKTSVGYSSYATAGYQMLRFWRCKMPSWPFWEHCLACCAAGNAVWLLSWLWIWDEASCISRCLLRRLHEYFAVLTQLLRNRYRLPVICLRVCAFWLSSSQLSKSLT